MSSLFRKVFREPANALTHLSGALLSMVALGLLIQRALDAGSITMLAAFLVFGLSLILLYTSSTLYHSIRAPMEVIIFFRKLDHMMIYVLIAGTFTPFCLLVIGGIPGITLLTIVWTMALSGIILKLFVNGVPRWLSVSLYIVMGWAGIALIPYMIGTLPVKGMIWLAAGGVIYTIGAVIYGTGKPNPLPDRFGYHEIWHLFVLAGSFAHFWAIYRYVALV